jgi:hypothetical protein
MKRGVLVATLVVAAAGVASANLLTGSQGGSSAPVQAAAPDVAPRAVAKAPQTAPEKAREQPLPPPAVAVAAPNIQRVSVETRQAPVPLLMKSRPAANLPVPDDKLAAARSAADRSAADREAAAAGDDGAGERAARAAIEADGYKGVKVLRKGSNGVWHATALRGTTPVQLTVDASGSVSAD